VLLGGGADVIEVRLAQAFRLDLTLWGTHAVAYLNHAQPGTGYAAVAP
jgi:hypothetical protein